MSTTRETWRCRIQSYSRPRSRSGSRPWTLASRLFLSGTREVGAGCSHERHLVLQGRSTEHGLARYVMGYKKNKLICPPLHPSTLLSPFLLYTSQSIIPLPTCTSVFLYISFSPSVC